MSKKSIFVILTVVVMMATSLTVFASSESVSPEFSSTINEHIPFDRLPYDERAKIYEWIENSGLLPENRIHLAPMTPEEVSSAISQSREKANSCQYEAESLQRLINAQLTGETIYQGLIYYSPRIGENEWHNRGLIIRVRAAWGWVDWTIINNIPFTSFNAVGRVEVSWLAAPPEYIRHFNRVLSPAHQQSSRMDIQITRSWRFSELFLRDATERFYILH